MTASPHKPEQLLPCPFCGGEAEAHEQQPAHRTGKPPAEWVVDCRSCPAVILGDNALSEAEAIIAWNTRHRTRADRELVEGGSWATKVPAGQTPLNEHLSHRYLDVVSEGAAARDSGDASPYHGQSLEHCLHAIGWVQRDLRLALDECQALTRAGEA